MSNTSPFIVAEKRNGSACVKSAYTCYSDADFIGRIAELASRSGESIESVEDAVGYLDERYAQTTSIIDRAEFDSVTPESWDTPVIEEAISLGWYSEPEEDGDE